ncbi:MAG: PAS domain S-box protein, partial [Anaerolineae bacterium]|nr:PAS domain S-box protein [Anaerolineae bacterium]
MQQSEKSRGSCLLVHRGAEPLEALAVVLVGQGYELAQVPDAGSALEALQGTGADVILVSSSASPAEIEAVVQGLGAGQDAPAPPILAVVQSEEADVAPLLAAGAADWLRAPFRPDEVVARIELHRERARLGAQQAAKEAELQREHAARVQAERALQEAEQSGQNLVENLSEAIYTADAQGVVTYISPAIERLLGYEPSEVIGQPTIRFMHGVDQVLLQSRLERILAGESLANEYQMIARSGELRWMRTSSQPVFSEGEAVGMQGVLTDVTERKEAEERIQKQNDFLTSVLESLTHPFYVVDAHDYTVVMANSAARFEGRSGSTTCYALTHRRDTPCDLDDHPCPLREIKRTRRPASVEHIHYDADGKPRHHEVYGYPLFDEEGNVARVIEYTLDVTERTAAEQALRDSERRYRQLLQALQEGIWVIDEEQRTTFVNPRMAEMLGYTVEEMVGKNLYFFLDEHGTEVTTRNLERRRRGIREQHDFELIRKDGSRIYTSMETSPITDEAGNYAGAIAGVQDMTERRRAEEALQKSEALLRETQRLAQVGGWELDLATPEMTWTEEVYRIHHVPAGFEPTLGQALGLYHPEDRPELERAIERAKATGEPWDLELRLVTAQEQEIWVRSIGRAELQDGRVTKLSGTCQDITEHRRAQKALREAAAAAERSRLARDLHDSVTQALFSASLVAEVLPQVWRRSPAEAQRGLEELRLLTRNALAEMRTLLLELRPTALVQGRLNELLWQLTEATTGRTQLVPVLNIEPVPKLPPEVQVAFYRVAQEALHNVVKHARANEVSVGLNGSLRPPDEGDDRWRGQLTLSVSDDGQGFEPKQAEPDCLGLAIMRERAESIDAALTIAPQVGKGTQVT